MYNRVMRPESSPEWWKVAPWLPEGRSGCWRIERKLCKPGPRSGLSGEFTGLVNAGDFFGTPVMSDTPGEVSDHQDIYSRAFGRVLIHGLGIGMIAAALLRKPEVDSILIIEKEADVIALVAGHLERAFADSGKILTIRQGDALAWKPDPGARWDVVWHDIWPSITSNNLPEMATLHRRFARRCGWQGSWKRRHCEYLRSIGR